MTADLDHDFGTPRAPEKVDSWEMAQKPVSLSKLADAAPTLKSLTKIADQPLLSAALRAKNFLWIMDQNGEIFVAVEELAPNVPGSPYTGFPRRRSFTHPREEKKLGHPTLIGGGKARIAGEVAFDFNKDAETLQLVLNANSGRYCRQKPPSSDQIRRVAEKFRAWGLEMTVDLD